MIAILISWCLLTYILLNFGVATTQLFKISEVKIPFISLVLGAFSLMLLTTSVAFFFRINLEYFVFILICSFIFHFKLKDQFYRQLELIKGHYLAISKFKRGIFWVLFLLILAQSSNSPYLLDNESYYVQTIQWLNEYGLVKGVANLHPFFGQYSGWHILQSALNFSFIGDFFNDLNGLFLVIYCLFALYCLEQYQKDKQLPKLILALTPIFTVFLVPFLSSPSQDIPIFLISQIIIFLFINHYKQATRDVFFMIFLMVLMLLFIKVTTITFIIFPILLFIKVIRSCSRILIPSMSIATLVLILFLAKNFIVTGFPMFPSAHVSFYQPDWSIPKEIQEYNYGYARAYALVTTAEYYESLNFFQKISTWLQLGKLRGLFNNTMVLLLIISPALIWFFKKNSAFKIVYLIGLLQIIFLLSTSAQYRFYFNYYIFFTTLVLAFIPIVRNKTSIVIFSAILLAIIPVFIAIPLNKLTNNKFALDIPSFHYKQWMIPHKNSKFKGEFKTVKSGNLRINYPIKGKHIHNDVFYWSTGDGELPCTSKEILTFFEEEFGYRPELRGNSLKEGFKAVKQ